MADRIFSVTELMSRMRDLLALAERGGAAAKWLGETTNVVAATLAELEEWRLGIGDPRRARMLKETRRMMQLIEAAERAGYEPIEARRMVREHLGLDKHAFGRRVALSRDIARLSLATMDLREGNHDDDTTG